MHGDISGIWPYIAGATVTGPRHEKDGVPGQDAWGWQKSTDGTSLIAVADGLSSVRNGGMGSAMSVSALIKATGDNALPGLDMTPEGVLSLFVLARKALEEQAAADGTELGEYGTTLLILMYREGRVITGQIGDGMIISGSRGVFSILSIPATAGYANETASLTAPDWEPDLIIRTGTADTLIMATDGCQGVLARKERTGYVPYLPFITPFRKFVMEGARTGRDGNQAISELLLSRKMREFSYDDKTMVILCDEPEEQS